MSVRLLKGRNFILGLVFFRSLLQNAMSTVILKIVLGPQRGLGFPTPGYLVFFKSPNLFLGLKENKRRKVHFSTKVSLQFKYIYFHKWHNASHLSFTKKLLKHTKRGNILFMSMFISYFFSSKKLLIYAINILKNYVSLFFRWLQIRIFWSQMCEQVQIPKLW